MSFLSSYLQGLLTFPQSIDRNSINYAYIVVPKRSEAKLCGTGDQLQESSPPHPVLNFAAMDSAVRAECNGSHGKDEVAAAIDIVKLAGMNVPETPKYPFYYLNTIKSLHV
jgi:hypothetical protein